MIGLFGGSFDPPHLGHLALVQAGLKIGLDEIWVIPAFPVHRELSNKVNPASRFQWLQKAFKDQSRVQVLDWEISQSKPTPTIDTLHRFKAKYPHLTPWLMLGEDAWRGFNTWHEYPKHQQLCNVAVFARQGKGLNTTTQHANWQSVNLENWSTYRSAGHCCDISVLLPEISATLIRKRAMLGLSLTDLVPKVLQSDIETYYK